MGLKPFDPDSVVYLFGNGKPIPGEVWVDIGHAYIFDAEIDKLRMYHQPTNTYLTNLNLSNVTIKKGDWELGDIRKGTWDNVRLYGPIDLKDAKIGPITGHNVRFMDGSPWVNGQVDMVQSPTPLKIERPPVPTLEELGLAEFWRKNDFPPSEHKITSVAPNQAQGLPGDTRAMNPAPGESRYQALREAVGDFCYDCKDWFVQVFLGR